LEFIGDCVPFLDISHQLFRFRALRLAMTSISPDKCKWTNRREVPLPGFRLVYSI
jgi:hypothetical protein